MTVVEEKTWQLSGGGERHTKLEDGRAGDGGVIRDSSAVGGHDGVDGSLEGLGDGDLAVRDRGVHDRQLVEEGHVDVGGRAIVLHGDR